MTRLTLAAAAGDPGQGWLVVLILVGLATIFLRHQWHVRRYTEMANCHHCEGSGKVTSKTFLGFGRTTVRGLCPKCGGDAWIARRRSERDR